MKLVYESNYQPVLVGDITKTFRGDLVKVLGICEPYSPASTGRVIVQFVSDHPDNGREFYPGVIGAKWIGRTDR